MRALVEHFAAMGGVPLLAVFDRPKTVALAVATATAWSPSGIRPSPAWRSTSASGVELCWPQRPQQKGSVENLVGWVKGSFFKQRRFLDDEDLGRSSPSGIDEVNTSARRGRPA